jgi:hypothetical protein
LFNRVVMHKLSRRIYDRCIGSPESLKALAFAVYMKNVRPASVVVGWSYRLLSSLSGVSPNTARRRVMALAEMGLVRFSERNGVRRIEFGRLGREKVRRRVQPVPGKTLCRTKRNGDIDLSPLDMSSVGAVEDGLRALLPAEIQRRKEHLERSAGRKGFASAREKAALEENLRRRGKEEFTDDGISVRHLCGRMRCSPATAIGAVRRGTEAGLYSWRIPPAEQTFVGKGRGRHALKFFPGCHFATDSNVYRMKARVFILPDGRKPGFHGVSSLSPSSLVN